jgi:hypothetical protein
MLRIVPALVLASLASPAVAGTYSAKPITPVAAKRIIGRDIVWSCGPDACQGATEYSRPIILCQGFAKRAGRLESFVANGRAFGPAELDRCNSAAKGGVNPIVAKAN